eukprot:TRINITY_DN1351_c0_g1_i1.p1 TRINITY_DN1351_c0_g1~~TRINITY_DN1351_c0_g1_i1.p1  ORF type:complete len:249 (-),score=9.69 TRINITY_DN1351_c0_g1_i1:527-1273(-)
MGIKKRISQLLKSRGRQRPFVEGNSSPLLCPQCNLPFTCSSCSNPLPSPSATATANLPSSMASKYAPSAPSLPPDYNSSAAPIETQTLIPPNHGQSYQNYTAFGTPVWTPQVVLQEYSDPNWRSGLCDCCADVPVCLLGLVCPCFLLGKIAENIDGDSTSCLAASLIWLVLQQLTSCGCIYSCGFRRRLRNLYGIPEKPLPDCIVHYLCWPCAFCQEYRELKARSRHENVRVFRETVTVPPQYQSMSH